MKRSDDIKGFKVLPKSWIVERTFGWLIQSSQLIQDHEVKTEHSGALIHPDARQNRRLTISQTAS